MLKIMLALIALDDLLASFTALQIDYLEVEMCI